MNKIIIAVLIILALAIGATAGYYYALLKVDQDLSNETLEQVNPFSDENLKTNPYKYDYINPFE